MEKKFYGMIYLIVLLLATIFTCLASGPTLLHDIITYLVAVGIGSFVAFLAWLVDKGKSSLVILENDTIEFKGAKTPNKRFKLSNFDNLSFHKGFLGSYLKLERNEGEPPNWYKAFGRPNEKDKEKLNKLIKIANKKMKDK